MKMVEVFMSLLPCQGQEPLAIVLKSLRLRKSESKEPQKHQLKGIARRKSPVSRRILELRTILVPKVWVVLVALDLSIMI